MKLVRLLELEGCTIGILRLNDAPTLIYTLEPAWCNNEVGKSCIPVGHYTVERWCSPAHGDCLVIPSVPGRSGILIHSGNTREQTSGCLLPGLRVGRLGDDLAVLDSRRALKVILNELTSDSLTIVSAVH